MAKIYALANNKGGVRKTTTTINLGHGLARRGYKTLIVDTDPQCNTTYTLEGYIEYIDDLEPDIDPLPSLYDVILGVGGNSRRRRTIDEIIAPVTRKGSTSEQESYPLYIARGSIELSTADFSLASEASRENILRRALAPVMHDFDYILIDTAPTLGILPVNAFVAAGSVDDIQQNGILIPIGLQVYAVLGIRIMEDAFRRMRDQMEIPLPVLGAVSTMVKNTKNATNRMKQVKKYYGLKFFAASVPVNEKVEEAADEQVPLYDYAENSTGARAYLKMTNEFLYRTGSISLQDAKAFLVEQKLYDEAEFQILEEYDGQ
jgi:chromosome partitioning protein